MLKYSRMDSVITKWAQVAMGSYTSIGSCRILKDERQEVVDEYFRDHSRHWRDVYQAGTLSACIYRERLTAVLAMVDKLGLSEQSKVLEIGCGAGLATVALAKRGLAVTAVDTVENMLGLTRQAAVEAGVGIRVKTSLADMRQLSFRLQFFDLVIAVGVLPWLVPSENALAEMFGVTRSGGDVILTVDNNWCLNQILDPRCFPGLRPIRWKIASMLEVVNMRAPSKPRLHRHSVRHLDELIRGAGFQKLKAQTLGFGPFTCFRHRLFSDSTDCRVHRALQGLADRRFPGIELLGTQYVVLAQRP